ncbi:MAG: hypothetical protein ABIP93_21110 [Gemmatimonadaceae bacterium]
MTVAPLLGAGTMTVAPLLGAGAVTVAPLLGVGTMTVAPLLGAGVMTVAPLLGAGVMTVAPLLGVGTMTVAPLLGAGTMTVAAGAGTAGLVLGFVVMLGVSAAAAVSAMLPGDVVTVVRFFVVSVGWLVLTCAAAGTAIAASMTAANVFRYDMFESPT